MSVSTTTRAVLLAGAALFAVPAAAQDAARPAEAPADTAAAEAPQGDVVVTGSRIRRPDYEAPNPVVSLDAAKLQQSGNVNVTNFLQRVPALTNSRDNTRTAGNSQTEASVGQVGLNLLDLRGLGPERTLVLVNGRRHVAGQLDTAAVDINSIPTDLIERVDVLTGAASAVYGADGVSGVVNFILRRDFDGLAARTQFGISEEGDTGNRFASVIAGRNFADGRANVTLAYEYNAEDALANEDRDFLRFPNRINFTDVRGFIAGYPYRQAPVAGLRYADSSTYGYTDIAGIRYRGDGALYTRGTSLPNTSYTVGGDDTPIAGYIGDILPSSERHAVNLLARFDASDAFKLSVEGKFVQTTVSSLSGYGGNYPASFTLDNPYIPDTILAAAQAAGLTTVDLNRNNFDIPRRGERDRRRTWRGVVDATGRITEHASYDVSYTYGRTEVRATKLNDRLNTEFLAALDVVRDPVTGQPVCRSAQARAAGCLPVNTFGADTVDPGALDYFLFDPVSDGRIEQHVVNAALSGDFGQFFRLPGGPVQFAAGGEYRKESSRFQPAAELLTPGFFYGYDEPSPPTPSRGSFYVWELFGELNAPILEDQPFAAILSVGAAGRYSNYSSIGETSTYQFNGVWAPVRDISFRGSYGRSVRAPNVGEIFRPETATTEDFDDPCYVANRDRGSQYRLANCTALVTGLGGDLPNFTAANDPGSITNVPGRIRANPDLRAEEARTWTAGVVLRPRFVPGLSVALDWYDIDLTDAISTPPATTVADLCVDQPTLDNVYCDAITRRQGTGYINGFVVQPQNVARFRTAGLELNASYVVDTARLGRFDLRLVGGYLHRLEQIDTPGAQVRNNVDATFRPQWNATFSPTWTKDALTLSYNLRWQSGVRRFDRFDTDDDPNYVAPEYFRFKELWQHDVQVQVQANDAFAFYAGVNNLANQKPENVFQTNVPISPVGRFFYAGARVTLDRR